MNDIHTNIHLHMKTQALIFCKLSSLLTNHM